MNVSDNNMRLHLNLRRATLRMRTVDGKETADNVPCFTTSKMGWNTSDDFVVAIEIDKLKIRRKR